MIHKWTLFLLLLTGCAVSTAVDTRKPLVSADSFAQPDAVVAVQAPPSIVTSQKFQWSYGDTNATFNLYYSSTSSSIYDNVISNITPTSTIVSNMVPGVTYYLAASAVDPEGLESDLSDQLVYTMPTTLEFGLSFDQSVTNVSVQSSTDLMTWQPSNARARTNGLWRVDVDTNNPVEFFRGIGQVAPAL